MLLSLNSSFSSLSYLKKRVATASGCISHRLGLVTVQFSSGLNSLKRTWFLASFAPFEESWNYIPVLRHLNCRRREPRPVFPRVPTVLRTSYCRVESQVKTKTHKSHFMSWNVCMTLRGIVEWDVWSHPAPSGELTSAQLFPLASINIWSSCFRRLCSTWRRPLSSASRMRRWRSASMAKAWILLSSCSLTSSLDRKSNISASTLPSRSPKWFSSTDNWKTIKTLRQMASNCQMTQNDQARSSSEQP